MEKRLYLSRSFIGASVVTSGVLIVFLVVFLLSSSTTVLSQQNDSFTANVTVANANPVVSNVLFNGTAASANITLTAASNNNLIMCNATITDNNGYQDVVNGVVNATFWHMGTSTLSSPNDKNNHYTNTSCSLIYGSGTTVTALCTAMFEHEALNGTWNCTIFAKDAAGGTGYGSRTNDISELVALDVNNASIHFGTMTTGQNSSSAIGVNVTNEGNVMIDVQVKALSDMNCSAQGNLGAGNISFNLSAGNYDSMSSNKLSYNFQTMDFNLVQQGIDPFPDTLNATNNTWWTINIPYGVRGECNNTIYVHAIKG